MLIKVGNTWIDPFSVVAIAPTVQGSANSEVMFDKREKPIYLTATPDELAEAINAQHTKELDELKAMQNEMSLQDDDDEGEEWKRYS